MKRFAFPILFLTLGLSLVACGGSSGANALPDPNIRFVNVAPGVSLDLYVDEDITFANSAFLDPTTTFKKIKDEVKDFILTENGSSVAIDSQSITFAKDLDLIFIGFGLKNFGAENEKRLRFTTIQVNRRTPNGTKARVYAFNALVRKTGEQSFAVNFKNPGTISTINFNPVDFGQITSQEIDAGPQTLVAQRQFTETEVATVTKNFEPGKVYFMVLTGIEDTTGATAPAVNFFEIQNRD